MNQAHFSKYGIGPSDWSLKISNLQLIVDFADRNENLYFYFWDNKWFFHAKKLE